MTLYIDTGTICGGIGTSHGAGKIKENQSRFGGDWSPQSKINLIIVSKKTKLRVYIRILKA